MSEKDSWQNQLLTQREAEELVQSPLNGMKNFLLLFEEWTMQKYLEISNEWQWQRTNGIMLIKSGYISVSRCI